MTLKLDWLQEELHFKNAPDSPPIELHGSKHGVTSPTQALAYSVMGCMAMDIVHMLQKGRHPLESLSVTFDGQRAEHPPRRYTAIHLRFDLTGDIPDDAVTRAIALSHEKYCSVSNSLQPDIDFKTTFTIVRPQEGSRAE